MPHSPNETEHMTGPQVLAWFGISDMTLWRWLHAPALGFPQPDLIINRRRYWRAERIRSWKPPAATSAATAQAA